MKKPFMPIFTFFVCFVILSSFFVSCRKKPEEAPEAKAKRAEVLEEKKVDEDIASAISDRYETARETRPSIFQRIRPLRKRPTTRIPDSPKREMQFESFIKEVDWNKFLILGGLTIICIGTITTIFLVYHPEQ
jgi:hypothetical protein